MNTSVFALDTLIEEVVVSGNRNLLRQNFLGSDRTDRLSEEDQVSANRTVADWIEKVPGISLNGQGGLFQSYSIRGMSRGRIRTEVDGVPILTDRTAGNTASFLPPGLIELVSTSREPGSTLYGSEAMGGVVDIQTATFEKPRFHLTWQDSADVKAVTAGAPVGSSTSFGLSLRSSNSGRSPSGVLLNIGFEQAALILKTKSQWNGFDISLGWLPSYGRNIGKSNKNFPEKKKSYYPTEKHSLVNLELQRGQKWLWRFYHHWQQWGAETESAQLGKNGNLYQGHTLGTLVYASFSPIGGVGRIGGEWLGRRNVEIRYREWNNDSLAFKIHTPVEGRQDNLAFFIDQQWALDNFSLGLGIRYDHTEQAAPDSEEYHGATSANFKIDWSVSDNWIFFGRWGTGFRFPSLTELYYRGNTPRGQIRGNPDLDPERNHTTELGIQLRQDKFSFSLSGYRTKLRSYIERYSLSATERSYRNIGDAFIEGYEAIMTHTPNSSWKQILSYQYQDGQEYQTDNWLSDLNPPSWRYFLSWQGAKVSAHMDLMFRSARSEFGEGEKAIDSVTLASFQLAHQLSETWRVALTCTNFLDEEFVASADDQAPFQLGRIISVGLHWTPG